MPDNTENIVGEFLMNEFALAIKPKSSWKDLESRLSIRINELIDQDFGKLVAILYRIDVSESKLRQLMQENAGEPAGGLIARMIIQRQLEKIKSREEYKSREKDSDEEKW